MCGRVMCQLVLWIKGKNVHMYLLTLGLLELIGVGEWSDVDWCAYKSYRDQDLLSLRLLELVGV